MKAIDQKTWKRKKHFDYFSSLDYPHFNLVANVQITKLIEYAKANNLSGFKCILFSVVKAANAIPELRQRIRQSEVVEHPNVHPSYTSMTNQHVFTFTEVSYNPDPKIFFENMIKKEAEVKNEVSLEDDEHRDDYLFLTSIPWVSFTSFVHPIHMNPVDSVPRISWGKYFIENEQLKMPLGIQAHHALVDGWHIGQFFEQVQILLDQPEKLFKELLNG